jgi:L-amino acid N-acyltransferase YncA
MIRSVNVEDAKSICEIYNHYVLNTTVTFEESAIAIEEMQNRIKDVTSHLPWYVAEEQGRLVGYAYATKWKARSAYRFSVESTVYVHHELVGKGIGKQLYQALISELRTRSLHCVLGGIALPNEASIALHEKMGFVKTAQIKEVGRKFDQWLDVGYWELIL